MDRQRGRRSCTERRLELAFLRLFSRLDLVGRRDVAAQLAQPFRRQWLIVDAHGVTRLED